MGNRSHELGALQFETAGVPRSVLKCTLLDDSWAAITWVTSGCASAVVNVRKRQALGSCAPVGWPAVPPRPPAFPAPPVVGRPPRPPPPPPPSGPPASPPSGVPPGPPSGAA